MHSLGRFAAFVTVVALVIAGCGGPPSAAGDRIEVGIEPSSVILAPGVSVEFQATVSGSTSDAVAWTSTAGRIEGSGATVTYTAPDSAGEHSVTVTSTQDDTKSASAHVTVSTSAPGGTALLEVRPASLTLTSAGDEATLRVVGYDSYGDPTAIHGLGIEWRISDASSIDVERNPDDPSTVTVRATADVGSAVVAAAATSGPEMLSNPVGVSVASVRPTVRLVSDATVRFPFTDVPPNAQPSSYSPPGWESDGTTATVAGFTDAEIAALLDAEGTTLLYPVILDGEPPAVDDLLLGVEGSAVMGRVRQVETRAGASLVQLEQVPLEDVFEQYVFTFDSESLSQQGLLSTESWLRPTSTSSLRTAAGWIPNGPDCTIAGGLDLNAVTATLDTKLTPIIEADIDLREDRFSFVVGVDAASSGQIGVDLQGGVSGTLSCDAGESLSLTMALPAGPLATLISAGAVLQPKLEVAVSASAGPRFGIAGTLGASSLIQAGFGIDGAGVENLSRMNVEPVAAVNLVEDDGWGDMSFSLTPGYYAEGDVGVQLGGFALEKTCALARFVPKVGDVCDDVQDALFLEALQGELGVELQSAWDSPRRVLNEKASDSRLLAAAVASVALRNDALNSVLQRFGFAAVELELVRGQVDGPTFYRVFQPDAIALVSTHHDGAVAVGGTVQVIENETLAITVAGTYADAYKPSGDTPLFAGEVWTEAGNQVASVDVQVVGDDTLAFELPVTAAICAQASSGTVPLRFLGFNRMLGLVPTAGYLGDIRIECVPASASIDVAIEPESVTIAPGESQAFTATVSGAADTSVTWDATCGTISGSGPTVTYSAPTSPSICSVTAISNADSSVSASATVEVASSDVGLIAHWTFDDCTGNDATGRGNTVSLVGGGTIACEAGVIGSAVALDGTRSLATAVPPDGLPIGSADRTVAVWAYMTAGNDSRVDRGVAGYGSSSTGRRFVLQYGLGQTYVWGVWQHSCSYDVIEGSPVDLCYDTHGSPGSVAHNRWYHLVATHDSDTETTTLYVDGQSVGFRSTAIDTTSSVFAIGKPSGLASSDWPGFAGRLDEVRLYDRTLSPSEVEALFQKER